MNNPTKQIVQSQAALVYGVDLGTDIPAQLKPDAEGNIDLKALLSAEAGLVPVQYSRTMYKEFIAYVTEQKKLEEACPVELWAYNFYEDSPPRYMAIIRGHAVSANSLESSLVSPSVLAIPEERLIAAKQFCERYGIDWSSAGWRLVTWRYEYPDH